MNTFNINATFLQGKNGVKTFAVLPYDDYEKLISLAKNTQKPECNIPSEIVDLVIDNGYTAVRAWREYLQLSQDEVAKRLGISQPAYSKKENSDNLRKKTREEIANALGLHYSQLDF